VQLENLHIRQGVYLLGVDQAEAAHRVALAVRHVRAGDLLFEHPVLFEPRREAARLIELPMEHLAELQRALQVLARLAVDEERLRRLRLVLIAVFIHAQDQPIRVRHFGEDERITTHVRRNVGVFAPAAFRVHEQVLVVANTNNGKRHDR